MSPTLLPAAGRSRESSAVRRHRAAPPQPAHRHRCACHDRSDRPPRVERLADDRPHRRSPILALVDSATGIGPTRFPGAGERDAHESAGRDAVRFQREVDRLNEPEKAARYQGTPLSDDEVRRLASYQKTFNEMTRGERFVQETLRGKAQTRAMDRRRARDARRARGTAVAHSPALEGFSCRHRLR